MSILLSTLLILGIIDGIVIINRHHGITPAQAVGGNGGTNWEPPEYQRLMGIEEKVQQVVRDLAEISQLINDEVLLAARKNEPELSW